MLFFEISVKLLFFFSGLESGYGCDGGTQRQTRSSNKAYLHTTTVESSGITVTSFKLYCSSQSSRIEFAPVYLNCLLPFVFHFFLQVSMEGLQLHPVSSSPKKVFTVAVVDLLAVSESGQIPVAVSQASGPWHLFPPSWLQLILIPHSGFCTS